MSYTLGFVIITSFMRYAVTLAIRLITIILNTKFYLWIGDNEVFSESVLLWLMECITLAAILSSEPFALRLWIFIENQFGELITDGEVELIYLGDISPCPECGNPVQRMPAMVAPAVEIGAGDMVGPRAESTTEYGLFSPDLMNLPRLVIAPSVAPMNIPDQESMENVYEANLRVEVGPHIPRGIFFCRQCQVWTRRQIMSSAGGSDAENLVDFD